MDKAAYQRYLRSDAWARKRALVIKRARYICEGCGRLGACEVHHRSYAHVGEEFLFELLALCRKCHKRLHGITER